MSCRKYGLSAICVSISWEALVQCLESALNEVDVLVTSGGVSMGEKVCNCECVHSLTVHSVLWARKGPAETSAGGTLQCHHPFWEGPHETRVRTLYHNTYSSLQYIHLHCGCVYISTVQEANHICHSQQRWKNKASVRTSRSLHLPLHTHPPPPPPPPHKVP